MYQSFSVNALVLSKVTLPSTGVSVAFLCCAVILELVCFACSLIVAVIYSVQLVLVECVCHKKFQVSEPDVNLHLTGREIVKLTVAQHTVQQAVTF